MTTFRLALINYDILNKNDKVRNMANVVIHDLKYQKIQKMDVPDHLIGLFEYFWMVTWDMPDGESKIQKVITEPKADMYFEQTTNSWKLSHMRKTVFEYHLVGRGSVFGVKLKPASQRICLGLQDSLADLNFNDSFETICQLLSSSLNISNLIVTSEMKTINEIIDLISSSEEILTVTDVVTRFEIEPRKLQRIFKDHIGFSLKWIISRYRLLEAIRMSQGGEFDLSEISYRLGYSDQAHFSREFKANCAMTPGEYGRIYLEGMKG